jgi:hypothetical protein
VSSRSSKSLRYDAETYLLACCAHACLKAHKTRMLMTTTAANPPPSQPTFGAVPPFAPRPQLSALSATPILNQPIDADEPHQVCHFYSQPARGGLSAPTGYGASVKMRRSKHATRGPRPAAMPSQRLSAQLTSSMRTTMSRASARSVTTSSYSILTLYLY